MKITLDTNVILSSTFWFGDSSKIMEMQRTVEEIITLSKIVEPKSKLDIIKEDPDDNKILECAVEGKVDYIISQDKHLLDIKEYKEIKIITPKDFLIKNKIIEIK